MCSAHSDDPYYSVSAACMTSLAARAMVIVSVLTVTS